MGRDIAVGQSASFSKTITEWDVYTFAGLISAVIGMQLPGPGTIYMGQTLKFLSPVRIGDTVTASVKVLSIDEVKHRAVLETTCVNQDGALLITGEAKVLLP